MRHTSKKRRLNHDGIMAAIGISIACLAFGAVGYKILTEEDEPADNAPAIPVMHPVAKLESEMWNNDAALYEIPSQSNPGETCLIVENREGIASACFPATAPAPTDKTRILTPAFTLESGIWRNDATHYEYVPASNNNIACLIVENSEDIEINCRPRMPAP